MHLKWVVGGLEQVQYLVANFRSVTNYAANKQVIFKISQSLHNDQVG